MDQDIDRDFSYAVVASNGQVQNAESSGETTAVPMSASRTLLGVFMIAIIVVLFALNSELLQDINQPYLIITIAHSTGILFLPIFAIGLYKFWAPRNADSRRIDEPMLIRFLRVEAPPQYNSWPRTIVLSLMFAAFYLFQNYLVVLAYQQSSVTLTNTIWRASSLLVYLLSIWILRDSLLLIKVVAVLGGLAGIVLIGFSNDSGGQGSQVLGFFLALASAVMTAFFNVLFRRFGAARSGTVLLALLHMGLIGAWHLFVFWVGIPIVDALQLEVFVWPTAAQWGQIALSASIAFVVNALTMLALIVTSPLFVSVGVDLVIPASWVADVVTKPRFSVDALGISGIALVFCGFIFLNLAPLLHRKLLGNRCTWQPPPKQKASALIQ